MKKMNSVVFGVTMCLPGLAMACGPDTDCQIEGGDYRIRMPDMPEAERPGAIVFAHGYRGSSQGTMGNGNLEKLAQELGVALLALTASADDWTIANSPQEGRVPQRDEVAYAANVVDDAVAKFGIDPDRVLATGFSAGGMMTWTLACFDSAGYAGFAPLAGTFWAPEPQTCDSPPANLIHYHGTADGMVPLAGRPIAQTKQGDVTKVIEMYAAFGDYADQEASQPLDGLSCTAMRNPDGKTLELCTFDGGHTFKVEYIRRAWEMFVPGA